MTPAYPILSVPAARAEAVQAQVLAAEPMVTTIILGKEGAGGDPDGRIAAPEDPEAILARAEGVRPEPGKPPAPAAQPKKRRFSLFGRKKRSDEDDDELPRADSPPPSAEELRARVHAFRDRMMDRQDNDPATVAELNRLIAEAEAAERNDGAGGLPDPVERTLAGLTGEASLAILPTPVGWQACAWLQAGRWIARAEAETHIAHHRLWAERNRARPITATVGSLGFDVASPPRDRDAALAVAAEHERLGADLRAVGADNLDHYAGMLLGAPRWWLHWQ